MGSFYSTCSVSHMVLTDQDKTSIQLLMPGYSTDLNGHTGIAKVASIAFLLLRIVAII
jgi:hypothetical protein